MAETGNTGIPRPLRSVLRRIVNRLAVHENVQVGLNARFGRGCVISAPHGLKIGNNVSVGPHSIVQVNGSIGDWVIIGMGVQIVGRADHAIDEVGVPVARSVRSAERAASAKDAVTVGRDVWIGASSVVLSGVTVGDCAIIGAGSVVTADVAPFAIVGGNPARVIGQRFEHRVEREQHLAALELQCGP